MKIQEKQAIRELPVKELEAQLKELEEKLFRMRFSHAVTPLKNGLELRHMRRHRARILTWIRQKERQK